MKTFLTYESLAADIGLRTASLNNLKSQLMEEYKDDILADIYEIIRLKSLNVDPNGNIFYKIGSRSLDNFFKWIKDKIIEVEFDFTPTEIIAIVSYHITFGQYNDETAITLPINTQAFNNYIEQLKNEADQRKIKRIEENTKKLSQFEKNEREQLTYLLKKYPQS